MAEEQSHRVTITRRGAKKPKPEEASSEETVEEPQEEVEADDTADE